MLKIVRILRKEEQVKQTLDIFDIWTTFDIPQTLEV